MSLYNLRRQHGEFVLGRRLHWQVGRLLTLEEAATIDADLPVHCNDVSAIAHQPVALDKLARRVDGGKRVAPAARAAGKPLEALYVNHISYEVNDYAKVRDFYVGLLGMKITEDDGKQCRLVFGNNMLIPRNRAAGGPAKVDHISYTVTNWDAEKDGLEEELKRRGLKYTGSAKTSFHVTDPEGMGVQFGGLHQ